MVTNQAINSASSSAALNPNTLPVLREGDRGQAVVQLQQLLNQKGFSLVVDGVFGAITKAAVIKFQQQRGLVVDGIVGAQTWQELLKSDAPAIRLVDVCRYYNSTSFPHQKNSLDWLQHQINSGLLSDFNRRWNNQAEPVLQQGDRGVAVTEAQRLLNTKGANLVVDGVFGSATRSAVIRFQQQLNLVADGIIGVSTWRELRKPSQAILLSVLFHSYNPSLYPYQNNALEWLQSQLSSALLTEFAKRWRNQVA